MKITNRILAIVLVISGLIPFMNTILAATNQSMIAEIFKFNTAPSPELQLTFVMLGAAGLFASITQFLAAVWVWTGKKEGLKLSMVVGIILLSASLYIFIGLTKFGVNDPSLYAPDTIKGLLILVLTIVALRKRGKVEAA
ncbi:MAG: hypothetical protein RID18_13540 [Cytophagales bacterium]